MLLRIPTIRPRSRFQPDLYDFFMGEQTFFGPAGGYDGIDATGDENLGISKVRRDAEDRNTVGFKFFHIRLSQTSESQADGRHLQFNNFPELIIKKRSDIGLAAVHPNPL